MSEAEAKSSVRKTRQRLTAEPKLFLVEWPERMTAPYMTVGDQRE